MNIFSLRILGLTVCFCLLLGGESSFAKSPIDYKSLRPDFSLSQTSMGFFAAPSSPIRFSNGREIKLVKSLVDIHARPATLVFLTQRNTVLRLEGDKGEWSSLNSYLYGYNSLLHGGVDIVEILNHGLDPDDGHVQYIEVEYLEGETLQEWLNHKFAKNDWPTAEELESILKFARSTAHFSRIGDFAFKQIYGSPETGWKLIDWINNHSMVRSEGEDTVFTSMRQRLERFPQGRHKHQFLRLVRLLEAEVLMTRGEARLCGGLIMGATVTSFQGLGEFSHQSRNAGDSFQD